MSAPWVWDTNNRPTVYCAHCEAWDGLVLDMALDRFVCRDRESCTKRARRVLRYRQHIRDWHLALGR